MLKPEFQATAEGLPTRRRILKGLATSTIVAALPNSLHAAAPIEMPHDMPPYLVECWPYLSRARQERVASNWTSMNSECRRIVEEWCELPEDEKGRFVAAMQRL